MHFPQGDEGPPFRSCGLAFSPAIQYSLHGVVCSSKLYPTPRRSSLTLFSSSWEEESWQTSSQSLVMRLRCRISRLFPESALQDASLFHKIAQRDLHDSHLVSAARPDGRGLVLRPRGRGGGAGGRRRAGRRAGRGPGG